MSPELAIMLHRLTVRTSGKGLVEITRDAALVVERSGVETGVCVLFIQHTSASLVIQENADPTVRSDLEAFFSRLAPEADPRYTHTTEGPDDMPAHIRAALTQTSLTIPIVDGALALGTWQGIYVWEHRAAPHTRSIIVQTSGN